MRVREIFSALWSRVLPTDFLRALDRAFEAVSQEAEPYAVAVSYTFRSEDLVGSLQVDATSGAITIYLPEQPVGNRRRTITKTDSSANIVTVDGNGSLINGFSQQALGTQYDSITVEPTGTGWLVVACVP